MNSPVMGPASCHYACSNSNSERKSRGSEYLGEEHGAPNEQKHSKRPPQEPKVIQMGGWKEKDQKYAQDFKNSLKSFLVKTKIIFKTMKMAKITTK